MPIVFAVDGWLSITETTGKSPPSNGLPSWAFWKNPETLYLAVVANPVPPVNPFFFQLGAIKQKILWIDRRKIGKRIKLIQ